MSADDREASTSHPPTQEASTLADVPAAKAGHPGAKNLATQEASGLGGDPGPSDDELLGSVVNERFRVDAVLGEGAMGKVYRAAQVGLSRDVAIKFIHSSLVDDGPRRARFEREAQVLSKLEHPGIVAVYDFGSWGGQSYIAMQYLDGETLEESLQRRTPPPLGEAVRIVAEVCDALDAAHDAGVVHRDLKPENVMLVGAKRQVKLVDFGVAKLVDSAVKLTQEGMAIGTPVYMAPEQCTGDPVGPQTDLYSLGIITYELLTGRPPFDAENLQGLFLKHMLNDPKPPSQRLPALHRAFDDVVLWALMKKREARPQRAGELKARLLDALAQAEGRVSDGHRRKSAAFAAERGERSQAFGVVEGPPPAAPKRGQGRVLVVGAGELSATSPVTHLELAGYTVEQSAALDSSGLGQDNHDLDAIVVDLGADASAALAALEPLLAAGKLHGLPTAVVGPDEAIEAMSRALELQLAGYVPRSKLEKRLAKVLRRSLRRR